MVNRMHVVSNPASGQPQPVLHVLNMVCYELGVDWDASITKESGDGRRFFDHLLDLNPSPGSHQQSLKPTPNDGMATKKMEYMV